MSEKASGEMRKEIAIVAGPREWGDTRESWLARVPRRVNTVTFRTVKALWYHEIKDPEHWAARDIRREADRIEAEAKRKRVSIAADLQTIIAGLNASAPDVHEPTVAALILALRTLRDVAES